MSEDPPKPLGAPATSVDEMNPPDQALHDGTKAKARTPSPGRKKRRFLFFRLGDELISHKPKRKLHFRTRRSTSSSSTQEAVADLTLLEAVEWSTPDASVASADTPTSARKHSRWPLKLKKEKSKGRQLGVLDEDTTTDTKDKRKKEKKKKKEKEKEEKCRTKKGKKKDRRSSSSSEIHVTCAGSPSPTTAADTSFHALSDRTDVDAESFSPARTRTPRALSRSTGRTARERHKVTSQTSQSSTSITGGGDDEEEDDGDGEHRSSSSSSSSGHGAVVGGGAGAGNGRTAVSDTAATLSPKTVKRPSALPEDLSISGAMSSNHVGVTATAFDRAAARSIRMSPRRRRRPSIFDDPLTHAPIVATTTVRGLGRTKTRRRSTIARSSSMTDLTGGHAPPPSTLQSNAQLTEQEQTAQKEEGDGQGEVPDEPELLSPISPVRPTDETVFTPEAMNEEAPSEGTVAGRRRSKDDLGKHGKQLDQDAVDVEVKAKKASVQEVDVECEAPVLEDPSTEERQAAALWFRHSWHGRTELSSREENEDATVEVELQPHSSVFRITDLEVGRVLGTGFYGQVLQCTNKFTGETVVVKELIRSDPEAKALFVQEMSLLKNLQHRNVLRFIGIFYSNDKLHLVTEYVANGTLRNHILNEAEPLPWDLRVQMARDISCGMTYLHEKSIIHRDLKTENCLVRNGMSIVLCDFGLARVMKGEVFKEKSTPLAERGLARSVRATPGVIPAQRVHMTVVGTPDWMAPEVVLGRDYNQSADVFSFGLIICSLIARMDPDPDLIRSAQFGLDEKKFRKRYAGESPEQLLQLAFHCCALEPEGRPSFGEVDAKLYLIDLEISSRMLGESEPNGKQADPTLSDPRSRAFTYASAQ